MQWINAHHNGKVYKDTCVKWNSPGAPEHVGAVPYHLGGAGSPRARDPAPSRMRNPARSSRSPRVRLPSPSLGLCSGEYVQGFRWVKEITSSPLLGVISLRPAQSLSDLFKLELEGIVKAFFLQHRQIHHSTALNLF